MDEESGHSLSATWVGGDHYIIFESQPMRNSAIPCLLYGSDLIINTLSFFLSVQSHYGAVELAPTEGHGLAPATALGPTLGAELHRELAAT